jgi:hypothetical protein
MNSELRLKILDTKYLHNSYIFTRFTQTKQELYQFVICRVFNKWTSYIYVCALNGQYVFAKNELTNFVTQDGTGVSDCRIEYSRNGLWAVEP